LDLGGSRQVERGFDDRVHAFSGKADEGKGLQADAAHTSPSGRPGQYLHRPGMIRRRRMSAGLRRHTASWPASTVPRRVGAAHRFNESADRVVMRIPVFVVQHGPPLDRFLGHFHADMYHAGCIRGRRFDCQFERIQGITGIPAGHVDQVGACIRFQDH